MSPDFTQEQPRRPEPVVVGGTETERQEAIAELVRIFREQPVDIFPEHAREKLRRLEYPKSPEEEAALRFANRKSNEIVVMLSNKS